MSKDDYQALNPENTPLPAASLAEVRNEIKEAGDARRAQLSGEPDLWGERVQSLDNEATTAIEPVAGALAESLAERYQHYADDWNFGMANDPTFRAEVQAAQAQTQAIKEGSRRAIAQREGNEFGKLRPQSQAHGKTQEQFAAEALVYLQEVKGLSPEQAVHAYEHGAFGRGTEQAKLFDRSNAWARDKRELQSLNAKRNLNENITLREAARRQQLMKRLGKIT